MKSLQLSVLTIISILFCATSFAQVKKETIKVWGNCGMCKTTIEKAAKKAGATSANWNEDSHQLKISYAVAKTSSIKIQQAIAKAGYDTQDYTADAKAYDKLHACCKYDRKEAIAEKCCTNENCNHTKATCTTACKEASCCKGKACCKSDK